MPGYRASPGGLFGSGVYGNSRPQIDLGDALAGVTSGASSLIQNAYLRKRQDAEMALQQQREQREAAHQTADLALRQKEADDRGAERAQDYELRSLAERHRFIEAGGIPAHTETQAVPAGNAPMPAMDMSPPPIARAMGAIPPVQVTPSNAPASTGPGDRVNGNPAPAAAPSSVPVNKTIDATTPESYDPKRSGAYERSVDTQLLRNNGFVNRDEARQEFQGEQQAKRLAAQQAGREYAAQAARSLTQLRAKLGTTKGAIGKAMTAGQQHNMNVSLAAGFLQAHGGYNQDALETFRGTPEGQALAKSGVTENDLLEGSLKLKKDPTTGQILGLVNSGAAKDVPDAANIVARADSSAKAGRLRATQGKTSAVDAAAPATSITQAEFDALKAKGFKDADIKKKYTITP